MCSGLNASARSFDEVPTDVLIEWSGNDLSIVSTVRELDLIVELRLVHGEDDIVWVAEALRLDVEQGATFGAEWPDLSAKGVQLDIPATVGGFVMVSTPEGQSLGSRPIANRLVMLGHQPPTVHEMSALRSLIPPGIITDSPGVIVTGVHPSVMVEQ